MTALPLITIDGPSASGKSSVSRLVAQELGWKWVSTGAFYRGLALASIYESIDPKDENAVLELAASDVWRVEMGQPDTLVFYRELDKTDEISGEKVGAVASQVSQIASVRQALLQRQRNCFDPKVGLVAEGRDCGTVVFPQAPAKVYLTASAALRAMRRSEEESTNASEIQQMQEERDQRDKQRKVAPLKMADGALKIDSSLLSLEEVVAEVLKFAQNQGISTL